MGVEVRVRLEPLMGTGDGPLALIRGGVGGIIVLLDTKKGGFVYFFLALSLRYGGRGVLKYFKIWTTKLLTPALLLPSIAPNG